MVVIAVKTTTCGVKTGLLTDETKLPVKQLRFGDTGNPNKTEAGYHTLGKLKCYGIA